MAIDTAAKQMSMLNFSDGTNLIVLPIPDGAYDSADRQHLLDCYSGIAFAALVAVTSGTRRQRQIKALTRARKRRRR